MGKILVHEFMSLDGVIDTPTWTSSGSVTLVRGLVADGLADELHLFMYPVTRGGGPRVFPDGVEGRFELAAVDRYSNGVVHLLATPAS